MHSRRHLFAAAILAGLTACTTGPAPATVAPAVVVFFTADSAALDDNAHELIRQVAQIAQANPSATVTVRGFAANDTGSAGFNSSLASARAQNVADGLVSAGVAPPRVHIVSRGGVSFRDTPTEARRVEIVVGS